jgi:hypothetical protein
VGSLNDGVPIDASPQGLRHGEIAILTFGEIVQALKGRVFCH